MIDIGKAIHSEWYNIYNWEEEKCSLDRKDYGQYISAYIRNQKQGLVLNLNGEWGTGKTHFLKQLYTNLLKQHNYPVIHINAWKSDFSNDPLLVIISELLDQLESLFFTDNDNDTFQKAENKKKLLANLTTLCKKGYNTTLDLSAAFLSTKNDEWDTGLDATALTTIFSNFKMDSNSPEKQLGSTEPRIGKSLTDNYKKQIRAIEDTKSLLKEYATFFKPEGEKNNKVFILIDELDRCRPTYAIEMLETIKHFFDIPNFVFVIATDTQQLSHSIKAVYGSGFDGSEYLSRFFNRTATLPQGKLRGFILNELSKTNIIESFEKNIMLPSIESSISHDNHIPKKDFIAIEIEKIATMYAISLRRLSQLIFKFEAIILSAFDDKKALFDFRMLLQLLAEYSTPSFHPVYQERKSNESKKFIAPPYIRDSYHVTNGTSFNTAINENINYTSCLLPHQRIETDAKKEILSSLEHSWVFLNNCRGNFNITDLQQNYMSNSPSPESQVDNAYWDEIQYFRDIPSSIWSKQDYFNAVEIAETLS